MTKNLKNTADKKISFLSKIAIYLSLGLFKGRLCNWRSLQPSRENIMHFKKKVLAFFGLSLPSWIRIRIRIANPDLGTPVESGTKPDPDKDPGPQHWLG
jgi:hypothetical protein